MTELSEMIEKQNTGSTNSFQGYKMIYRFNASHSMSGPEDRHSHTFICNLYISKNDDSFAEFTSYEKKIADYIENYRGVYLNDLIDSKPTLENICAKFFNDIDQILYDTKAYTLASLAIGDSPVSMVKMGRMIIASRANIVIDPRLLEEKLKQLPAAQ